MMTTSADENNEIMQYLLGTLSQAARQRVEERLLAEESFFEEVLLGEDELIDQYLNGELSVESRDDFEQHFLSTPERQRKFRFGKVLSQYIAQQSVDASDELMAAQPPPVAVVLPNNPSWAEQFRAFWSGQTWGLRTVLALAVVAIITSALWLSRPPSPQTFATLALTLSANNRADQGAPAGRVKLPLNADALKVSLTLPEQPSFTTGRYRVELVNDNGETNPLETVEPDARSVSVVIPAAQLARGQYALKLFTINADGTEQRVNGSYLFTIE